MSRRSGARAARSVCTTAWTSSYFRPADADERSRLRRRLDLPHDKFLIVLSSRISHEKDPETVLRAVAIARERGLDAVLLNLGGGHREFLALAARLGVDDRDASWVLARPAVHPMKDLADYFRAADAVALASLAEGAAYSTARGAGLRDARRRHGGGRDGGPASRVRIADAAPGRSRDGRRVPGDCRESGRGASAGTRGTRVRVPRVESREGVRRSGGGVRVGRESTIVDGFWRDRDD